MVLDGIEGLRWRFACGLGGRTWPADAGKPATVASRATAREAD
jgi:hypothetical protein